MYTLEQQYELLKDNPYFNYFGIEREIELRKLTKEQMYECFKKENARMAPYMVRYTNPYFHIPHLDAKHFRFFKEGDIISIQEKIDGSNAHFTVEENGFDCRSNGCILNENNHLKGFWFFVADLLKEKTFPKGLKIYGEWLTPHHCEYPADCYGRFYVFDIMENGSYWEQARVKQFCEQYGLRYVPVFYEGPFTDWKDVLSYVGRSDLGGESGESIVIKNMNRLNEEGKPFYVKAVDTVYQETNKGRDSVIAVSMEELNQQAEQYEAVRAIVTEARVRKIILKMQDENRLPAGYREMGAELFFDKIKGEVIRDCMKEEGEFVKRIGGKFAPIAVEVLSEMLLYK